MRLAGGPLRLQATSRAAWTRAAATAVSMVCFLVAAALAAWLSAVAIASGQGLGVDLRIMQALGSRWLASGTMYLPYQLAGPYSAQYQPDLTLTPGLYPPAAGPVFAALSLVPYPLAVVPWFAVPVGYLVHAIRAWRPAPWAWAAIAVLLAIPTTVLLVVNGGTSLWMATAVAAALRGHGWAAALLALKPSLAPFALAGVRSVRFWALLAVVGVLTLLGPWQDYVAVARNAQGLDYALWSIPVMAVPVVAWYGGSDRVSEGARLLRPGAHLASLRGVEHEDLERHVAHTGGR